MRRKVYACAAALAIAGCADATTAPAPETSLKPADASSKTFTYVIGSQTYDMPLTSCTGDPIDATLTEQSILTNYTSSNGATTVAFIGTYDRITGVGANTKAKYTGTQVGGTLSAITPGVTVQAVVSESILKAKGQKNTYSSTVTYYIANSDGTYTRANSFTNTGCTSSQAHAHDHDHDHDWDDHGKH